MEKIGKQKCIVEEGNQKGEGNGWGKKRRGALLLSRSIVKSPADPISEKY